MPKFPGFHLVPASRWVNLTKEAQSVMRKAGGFAVNDAFITLWDREATEKRELLILYGTYGSSKTVDRIQELVLTCITDKYFKCYYGREVFDLAKKELHSSIMSVIKQFGLEHLFDYSEKPNGSKDIICIANGNRFKPFGCDDEESFKGWDDATHVFVDEMNQITFKSFGMLQSRLRKMGARKCFVGCFNNCDVFEDHWICTTLLNKDAEMLDDDGKPVPRNIIEHFSTYEMNYFIDQADYRRALIEQAGLDLDRREAVLKGRWGAKTTGQPFYKNFRRNLHVQACEYNPALALHISWDENLNPYLPVGIFQLVENNIYCIDVIAAVNPYNSIRWVCNELYRRYGPQGKNHLCGMYIYGDATSRKDDTKMEKGKDFFNLIRDYLAYFKPKMRVGKSNPNVAMRGNFINDILGSNIYGLHINISPECREMITDLLHTSEAPDGNGKDKSKTEVNGVKGVQKYGHFTDLLDYLICYAYSIHYERYQHGGKKPKWVQPARRARNQF